MRFPVLVKIEDFLKRMTQLPMRIYFQAEARNPFQIFRLQALGRVNPITVKIQRPPGDDIRIQLTQRAGSRVARIRKARLARLLSLFVELPKCLQAEDRKSTRLNSSHGY